MHNTELVARAARTPEKSTARRLAERGLTTVEYAIGLVAAATAAIVLLRIFSDNAFFQMLQEWVLAVFTNLTMKI